MQTISFHRFNIPAPTSIAEMSKAQCRLLAGALYFNLEVSRLKILMFWAFLKDGMLLSEKIWYFWHLIIWPYFVQKTMLGYFLFRRLGLSATVKELSDEAIIELSDWHTEWLFDDNALINEPKFERLAGYYGPNKALNNLCFRQFRMTEEFAHLYGNARNENVLNTLLAWIYLPAGVYELDANDKAYRAALSPSAVKNRAEKIAKEPIEVRYYLYMWYLNAKTGIMKRFKEVFVSGKKKGIQTRKPLDNIREALSSMLVIRAEHVTKMEDTDFSSLFDVLAFFKNEIIQAERVK